MPFTRTFNEPISRLALDHIHAHPEEWNQKEYHCESAHCWIGWCDKFLGNHKEGEEQVFQETINSMGLLGKDYKEFINSKNTLAKLEALHAFHSTGVYGVQGYDTDGFDRQGFDVDGFNYRGVDARGFHKRGFYVDV